jgi:ribonuclease BN (tRNA processing enzyme)
VLLTHIHPDHCSDLVALQFALRNPLLKREGAPVLVCGHEAVGLLLARLRNAWPGWLAPAPGQLEFRPAAPGPVPLPGRTRARAFRIAHTETSLGYRLTLPDGFELAFSGDATEGEDLVALGAGADLLVLEAAVPEDRPVPGHLTPRRAGAVAAAARPRQLLLTHFYPPVLDLPPGALESQVRESFEGRLTLAEDGMVVPLTR